MKLIRKYGLLFYEESCRFCNRYLLFINRVNVKVPVKNRIKLISCEYTKYGVSDSLYDKYEKYISGFPTLILVSEFYDPTEKNIIRIYVKKSGINSIMESRAFLESYLNDVFVVPEYNKYRFDKECQVQQQGKFKGQVICR